MSSFAMHLLFSLHEHSVWSKVLFILVLLEQRRTTSGWKLTPLGCFKTCLEIQLPISKEDTNKNYLENKNSFTINIPNQEILKSTEPKLWSHWLFTISTCSFLQQSQWITTKRFKQHLDTAHTSDLHLSIESTWQ